jgi:hypothetical protein
MPMIPVLNAIEDLFARIGEHYIAPLNDNVVYIRKRIDDVIPRHDFSPQTRKVWLYNIVQRYDGRCPCGCGTLIVSNGLPIAAVWEEDHWYTRERNGTSDGWPVAKECNRCLKDAAYRESKMAEFQFFQKNLEYVTSRAIAKPIEQIETGPLAGPPSHKLKTQGELF